MPGLAKPDQGGKRRDDWAELAPDQAAQAFPCPAETCVPFQFYFSSFHVTRSFLWYFLGLQESTVLFVLFVPLVSPSLPRILRPRVLGQLAQIAGDVELGHVQVLLLIVATLLRCSSRNLSFKSDNEITHLKNKIQHIL